MRTHGHGQGYADINFIIPDLIGSLEDRREPYYAEVRDFGAAGSASLRYVDELPRSVLRVTGGEWGFRSVLAAGSPSVGPGKLLLGGQATRTTVPSTWRRTSANTSEPPATTWATIAVATRCP